MIVAVDTEALFRAQSEGVLSQREAFALEGLADSDGDVPEWLYEAVERLFLYFVEAGREVH